jgi:hypothetical protein
MKLNHRKVATLRSLSIIALASLSTYATLTAFVSLTAFAGAASAQDQLLWCETHVHSSNSVDAY